MANRFETNKYVLTVEGQTEKLYFSWLHSLLNAIPDKKYNVSIVCNVEQHPFNYAKRLNSRSTPELIHVCDIEGQHHENIMKFHGILEELKKTKNQKGISCKLAYSNMTFELWMILHKIDCNKCYSNRNQYLQVINSAFEESFLSLNEYKSELNFKRCLSKLSLDDVINAIRRANNINRRNKQNQTEEVQYCGYKYYVNNPSLTINEAVEKILIECDVLNEKS